MRTQTGWLRQVAAVAVVAGLALAQSVVAANRFVSNDGTWKMRDAFGEELPGTCYTLLAAALSNSSDTVIYVKNDYDCSADTPMSMDGTLNARYLLSSYRVTIRSESGDWRTGATLTGNWDPEGNHGRGANAFRVFSKSAYNNTGIQIIGFKLVDGATPTTDKESGNATPGCGGCVCGKGAHDRVTLRNCLIAGGSAGEGGGAFMCRIENCVVTNNYAAKGGGLSACAPIMDTQLTHNTTHESGGGAAGGHLSAAAAVLTNCVIACNVMGLEGDMTGGAIEGMTAVRCIITNNYNHGQSGGGCRNSNTFNCLITDNVNASGTASTVARGGGGVLGGTHVNALIARNVSGCYGSGARLATLYNCTIVDNVGTNAGGHTHSALGSTLYNCILWGNRDKTGAIVATGVTEAHASCLDKTSTQDDEFCIYTDPKFVNAASGDYVPKARACRNSAVVYDWMTDPADVRSKDLAGNARLADTAPDMGCYELQLGGFFILIQ